MQLLPCPFCGERDEREFLFVAEAGKARPDTTGEVSDETWSAYLYRTENPKGISREIWMHLTCNEMFLLERSTVTMEVIGVETLRRDAS